MIMITHTLINIRTSATIPWYTLSEEVHDRRQSAYMDTGKIVSRTEEETDENLTRTITTVFRAQEDFDEYTSDPIIVAMLQDRRQYNNANEILSFTQMSS